MRTNRRHVGIIALLAASAAIGCSASADRTAAEHTGSAGQANTGGRAARLFLTTPVTQRLQQRAAANDAAWTALAAHCDALAGGTMNAPNGNAYPNSPDVGQGYQGDGYLPEIMNLGLCFRVTTDNAAAARYGAAGGRLLEAMATPAGSGGEAPSTDSGYGIRNYGVGMAVGFDWLYPALSTAQIQTVVTSLDVWIDWYDASGFSKDAPIGNYFAGYLLAKTATAIATEGDNAKAAGYWSDVQARMFTQLMEPQGKAGLKGGGWPEGWQYGPRSVENYTLFLWAAKTGKGIDWWSQMPNAHDEAAYISYFAWPSLRHMDDQGTVHSQTRLAPPTGTVGALAAMMEANGDGYAATARSLAADMMATNSDTLDPWQKFLYWDSTLPTAPYTQQSLSYLATGPGHVSVRSTWQKDAVWATFVSGQYIDAPDSGEQYFNQGSVAIVQGDQPLLVNATGWLPQAGGDPGEQFVYDDTWANQTRLLNNTYYVAGAKQDASSPTTTHVDRFEEGGGYVRARGAGIDQMYAHGAVSQFTRDFVYLRPGTFVVYDRTTSASAADQWLSWHTASQPIAGTTADATQKRWDVKAGGATIGSIRSLLPENVASTTTSLVNGAAWRLENHAPTTAAGQDWLTVITSGAAVPEQTRLSTADGNVLAGGVTGVHVLGARNSVVLFPNDHAATGTTSAAHYVVAQTADADHVLFDMAPSPTGYGVTATLANGKLTLDVKQGGALHASANGTLAFVVTTTGSVAGAPPPPPPQGSDAGGGGMGGQDSGSGTPGQDGGAPGTADGGGSPPGPGIGGGNDGGAGSSGDQPGSGGSWPTAGGSSGCSVSASPGDLPGALFAAYGMVALLRRRRRGVNPSA